MVTTLRASDSPRAHRSSTVRLPFAGAAALTATLLASGHAAHAQTAAPGQPPPLVAGTDPAPSAAPLVGTDPSTGAPYGTRRARPAAPPEEPLLYDRNSSWALGWRAWMASVPSGIVSLFAHIEPGWTGSMSVATGPEFVYRSSSLEIQLGLMFVGYGAPPAYFRGQSDPENATEEIRSTLFGVYATSTFMYPIRFHRMVELQIGAGIGIGGIGGQLTRGQAFRTTDSSGAVTWQNCQSPAGTPVDNMGRALMTADGRAITDTRGDCMTDNQRYSGRPDSAGGFPNASSGYVEGNWASGGNVPIVLPWISLPQLSLHVRPHRNFDLRVDAGYMLIGYYVGGALHFVL